MLACQAGKLALTKTVILAKLKTAVKKGLGKNAKYMLGLRT
jgi:hypothetical protein